MKARTADRRAAMHEQYLRAKAGRRDLCECGAVKLKKSANCRACQQPRKPRPIADRLWSKVDRSGGPAACWPYIGARMHNGYGWMGLGGRSDGNTGAHRVAWTVTYGPIADGLYVLHRCDNRPCCNPAHLWLGTQGDNLRDMAAKGRHWATVAARRRQGIAA